MAASGAPAMALDAEVFFADERDQTADATRVESLKALRTALLAAPAAASREDFCRLFARAQRVLELEDNDLAIALQISRPTVGRWARAEAAPHPVGRKPVLEYLATRAARALRLYT